MQSDQTKNHPRLARGPGISQTVRAFDWWEYKLSPTLATIYATAFLLDISIFSLWPLFVLTFLALIPGAAYVSVINDFTDLKDDQDSGKTNRLIGKSRAFIIVTLACCILPGVAVAVYWRNDLLLLSLYLGAWTAFSLYSIPPFRLKSRGLLGIMADACGAHLFPTLLVVTLVFRWQGATIDPAWFISVGLWSLSFGLRGILWHQLSDLPHDEQIGLRTFAGRHKITLLHRLGNFAIFPLEIAAFAFMLWHMRSYFAFVFLGIYALLQWSRKQLWETQLVIVAPKPRYRILMLEYYEVFYPLAALLSSTLRYPPDAVIIAAHLILFPRRATQTLKDIVRLSRETIRRRRRAKVY